MLLDQQAFPEAQSSPHHRNTLPANLLSITGTAIENTAAREIAFPPRQDCMAFNPPRIM